MADEKKGMIAAFIRPEKLTLVIVTVSGIIYNVGMTAGPWLEGKLAQYLCDIIRGSRTFGSMAGACLYICAGDSSGTDNAVC